MDKRKLSIQPKILFLWKGLGVGFCLLLLLSCKPQVPSEYLSPGEMEDILYDYHLAIAMAQIEDASGNSHVVKEQAYKLAVLQKYGVTEQEFEASMQYYVRHTERLHDIYFDLAERLGDEALAHGASASQIGQYGAMTEKGDTADIWTGERAMVFAPQPPFNATAFYHKADTTYHRGDRLELHFDAQYIVQEGSRGGMAVMMVRFLNDSVATQMQHVNSNTHYQLMIADNSRLGIKEVRGYIMMTNDAATPSKSLKLLCLTNIHLVRIHAKEQQDETVAGEHPADSIANEEIQETSQQAVPREIDRGSLPAPRSGALPPPRQGAVPLPAHKEKLRMESAPVSKRIEPIKK